MAESDLPGLGFMTYRSALGNKTNDFAENVTVTIYECLLCLKVNTCMKTFVYKQHELTIPLKRTKINSIGYALEVTSKKLKDPFSISFEILEVV